MKDRDYFFVFQRVDVKFAAGQAKVDLLDHLFISLKTLNSEIKTWHDTRAVINPFFEYFLEFLVLLLDLYDV